MDYFKTPENYDCVVKYNDNTLYAWSGNRRDTFSLNGFRWVKTYSDTNTYGYSNYVCLSDSHITPSSTLNFMILPAVLVVFALFKIILNMFMGVRKR